MRIDLKPGFNKFDFKALNQGSSGPNGELRCLTKIKICSPLSMNLSTGATALLL